MVKFNNKVLIYEGVVTDVHQKGTLDTKTWDGLSYDKKMFQNITLLYLSNKFIDGNLLLNKLNIFQKYTFKNNIDILIARLVNANIIQKQSLTLLSGGGGKNSSIKVNKSIYDRLLDIKKGIENFLESEKNNSSVILQPPSFPTKSGM